MPLTPAQVVALLRQERVLTLTPTGRVRSIVEEVVGGQVVGSWWAHPRGKAIYACAVAVEESGEAVALKLIAGKVTFVHRSLWASLYRVVADEDRCRAAARALAPEARALLGRVEEAGELRLDQVRPAPPPKARQALDKAFLCHSEDLHTEKGSHTKVLRTWARWGTPEVKGEAARLGYAEALDVLAKACGGPLALALTPPGARGG